MATGGIYIKALPQGTDIIIDSTIKNKTGLFFNSVFVQDLLPKKHSVLIKKDGYYDYKKNLEVKGNEVTKLENVILFKKSIIFEIVTDKTQSPFEQQNNHNTFTIINNNLYYSEIQGNSNLNQAQKKAPILNNITAYGISNSNIIWLGLDGFLYSSNSNGQNTEKLSQIKLEIGGKSSYQLIPANQKIFLKENNKLLLFNQDTKSFQEFYTTIKDLKISPDGQKILYFNDHEILFSLLDANADKIFLNRFSEQINDCYWLNNDYVIFSLENKIIISEIDVRDGINTVNLPQKIYLNNGENMTIDKPKIFLDQQDKKLYILTQDHLLVSEKLIP